MPSSRLVSRLSLGVFAAVLALACLSVPEPVVVLPATDPAATATIRDTAPGWVFFSSNTQTGLTLEESLTRLQSREQMHGRRTAPKVFEELGITSVTVYDAVGDWEGGVENSYLVHVPNSHNLAALRCAAASLGLSYRQQAVLFFQARKTGQDQLTIIETSASFAVLRQELDRYGIRERTLLQGRTTNQAVITDPTGRLQGPLHQVARRLGGSIHSYSGRAETISGTNPDDASRHYRNAVLHWQATVKR